MQMEKGSKKILDGLDWSFYQGFSQEYHWKLWILWTVQLEMDYSKNLGSKTESKQLPWMLLFLQAHPIPSQSWWASHSCTGGIDQSTSAFSRHQTNIHVKICGKMESNAWYTHDQPWYFVETPTQELVVKISRPKKDVNSYTRVRCEAWDEFLSGILHRSWIKSSSWIPLLPPTQEFNTLFSDALEQGRCNLEPFTPHGSLVGSSPSSSSVVVVA